MTRLVAVAIAVLLAAALVLGWQAGDTPLPPPAKAEPAKWSLPKLTHSDATADLAVLKNRHPWSGLFTLGPTAAAPGGPAVPGGNAAPGGPGAHPAAAPPPSWRLAGVVERGEDRFALVAPGPGTGELSYLRLGDRLPDGSTLVAIAPDSATTADAKSPARRRVYRLFGEKH